MKDYYSLYKVIIYFTNNTSKFVCNFKNICAGREREREKGRQEAFMKEILVLIRFSG